MCVCIYILNDNLLQKSEAATRDDDCTSKLGRDDVMAYESLRLTSKKCIRYSSP